MDPTTLPKPDTERTQHSEKVCLELIKKIQNTSLKTISFADFMRFVLYEPGLGYYMASCQPFGAEGDFITAPEISPVFSQCVANQCADVLKTLSQGVILEFGAGTGTMAANILLHLHRQGCLPQAYYILELSPVARQRQRCNLEAKCPHLLDKIHWLTGLPQQPICGVVLANEVLDAMPVHRFHLQKQRIQEYFVTYEQDEWRWCLQPLGPCELEKTIQSIQKNYLSGVQQYTSEVCLWHRAWLEDLKQCLAQGLILIMDYGYPGREYYHPQRTTGTLSCFYRHRYHTNPFLHLGIQDITAHVDFTMVAKHAESLGFKVHGYTHQGAFLLNCGVDEILATYPSEELPFVTQSLKRLLLPQDMGELFKVMALSRRIDKQTLLGFTSMDRRHQLSNLNLALA